MDRWEQIESLFAEAVKQPPSEREAWLRDACAHDSSLYPAVASLVSHDVYETPETKWAATAAARLITPALGDEDSGRNLPAGTTLGPYSIVEVVGGGAMGRVYRARDARLNRDVAIKAIPNDLREDGDRFESGPARKRLTGM